MKQYKPRGRPMKRPGKTEFDYLYYILGLSAQEIAQRFQVKTNTVYNWACEYRKLD